MLIPTFGLKQSHGFVFARHYFFVSFETLSNMSKMAPALPKDPCSFKEINLAWATFPFVYPKRHA